MSYQGAVRGGFWMTVREGGRIACRAEPDTDSVTLNFFGPTEVSLTMSTAAVLHCRESLDSALRELAAHKTGQ